MFRSTVLAQGIGEPQDIHLTHSWEGVVVREDIMEEGASLDAVVWIRDC